MAYPPVKSVTRYVVTHIGSNGQRTLTPGQQGRHTFETAAQAQAWIDTAIKNHSTAQLGLVFGLPLEVRPCPCWPGHFAPQTCWFD